MTKFSPTTFLKTRLIWPEVPSCGGEFLEKERRWRRSKEGEHAVRRKGKRGAEEQSPLSPLPPFVPASSMTLGARKGGRGRDGR